MRLRALLPIALFLGVVATAGASPLVLERELVLDDPPEGVVILNPWGGISVRAHEGETLEARARIEAWAPQGWNASLDGAVRLRSRPSPRGLEIAPSLPETGAEISLALHLSVLVPRGTEVVARAEFGDVSVVDTRAGVDVHLESGNVRVRGATDRVMLRNGLGDVSVSECDADVELSLEDANAELRSIGGSASISQRFGRLRVRGVRGDLALEGLVGDIDAEELRGETTMVGIKGQVRLDRVAGPLRISVEAGDVVVSNVEGRAEIKTIAGDIALRGVNSGASVESSLGTVSVLDVSGDLSVRAGGGEVSARRIGGASSIASAGGGVTVEDAGRVGVDAAAGLVRVIGTRGRVDVAAFEGAVAVEDAAGGVSIEAGLGSVRVHGAAGPVSVRAREGHVEIGGLRAAALGARHDVSASRGSVTVTWPRATSLGYELDGERCVVSRKGQTEREGSRLQSAAKEGAARLRVIAPRGSVSLELH